MATLAYNVRRAQLLFAANQDAIVCAISNRLRSPERRQNALAWTWQHLLDGLTVGQAIHKACMRRATFGRPARNRWQSDALDHAEPIGAYDPAQDQRENAIELSWRIDDMPPRLQPVAVPLATGLSRVETAALLGVSPATISRRCEDIAKWIEARQGIFDIPAAA